MDDLELLQFKLARLKDAFALDFESLGGELIEGAQVLDDLKQLLVPAIIHLLERDRDRLMSILYQIDIAEGKSRLALGERGRLAQGEALAEAIIERHLRKLISRKKYWADQAEDFGKGNPEGLGNRDTKELLEGE